MAYHPDPIAETAERVARMNAINPYMHQKRFEIQIWRDGSRTNYHAPTLEIARLMLKSLAKVDDHKRPNEVIVSDYATVSRVIWWEKSWYGYKNRLRNAA